MLARGCGRASKSRPSGSGLPQCMQRWCGLKVAGVQCSMDHQGAVASCSLCCATGDAALAVGIRGSGCASVSRLWRSLAVLRPRAVPRVPGRTSHSAPGSAAAAGGALLSHSSSTSSCECASQEVARRNAPAACAHVYRLSDENPSSSVSNADFGSSAG